MQKIKLNVIPQGNPPVVYLSENDVGRSFIISLYDGDICYDVPSDASVTVRGMGFSIIPTASENEITVIVTEEMTIMPGDVPAEVNIKTGKSSLTCLRFIMHIERGT